MLLASGDVRIVRVWDAHREMKVKVRMNVYISGGGDALLCIYNNIVRCISCLLCGIKQIDLWISYIKRSRD